jgi:hypothetical protein
MMFLVQGNIAADKKTHVVSHGDFVNLDAPLL